MIGQTISHYKVLEKIGEGGMGQVYLAEDTSLERKVALKFLPVGLQADPIAHKRFIREAKSAAAIEHPYICNIKEVSQTEDGQDFIVMEYVEGQTLKEKLEVGPLPLDEAVKISAEVADALTLAHKRGIVHRDLKPANIMLTPQGHAKVMDFGLAKRVVTDDVTEQDLTSGLTREGSTLGTPAYMSPEQVRAEPVDHRADIFSFGIIFYEMLTGIHPFRRRRPVETMGAILHEEPDPLAGYVSGSTELLQETVNQLLAKNPDERLQTVEEMASRLSQLSSPELQLAAFLRSRFGKRLTLALTLIVTIALIGWWALRKGPTKVGGPLISSIAVLPLANLSGDPEQEYFADALTDALITDLSKIGALKVISRTSAMRYKGTNKPLPEIAQELKVDAIIEGSAIRSGDRVRISAQLIDVETDQAFWAETYERDFQDLLVLQSEVAQAVAREIQVAISPEETARLTSARPVDPEAYEAYLKGRMYWYKQTPQDVDRALQYFQLAEEKDPNFALAKLGMGYVWTYYRSVGLEPPGEMGAKVEEALRKAREIDPTLAEVYEAEADYRFYFDWDWEGAEESYKRGIELKPNSADMRLYYWEFLVAMNRPQEAQVQIETCLELDPYNTYVQTDYGLFLLSTRRFDDAINQFQKVLKTEGDFGTAQLGLWAAYHHKGMYELALASVKDAYSKWGDEEMVEALEVGFAEEGYRGAMRMAAEKLADRSELYDVLATPVAIFFAYAGEEQRTLDWLEKAFEERETGVVKLQVDPDWDSVRDEPRFQDLLRRMNLPEAQNNSQRTIAPQGHHSTE